MRFFISAVFIIYLVLPSTPNFAKESIKLTRAEIADLVLNGQEDVNKSDFHSAEVNYLKAFDAAQNTDDKGLLGCEILVKLGDLEFNRGNIEKSLEYLTEAEKKNKSCCSRKYADGTGIKQYGRC